MDIFKINKSNKALTLIELHYKIVRLVKCNARTLGKESRVTYEPVL